MSADELARGRPAGTDASWRPVGTIIPMTAPVVFTRVSKSPSAKAVARYAADNQRLKAVLTPRLGAASALELDGTAPGMFIVRETVLDEARDAPSPKAGRANLLFQFVSLRPAPSGKAPRALIDRTAFAFYDAASGWDDAGNPLDPLPTRGVVLVMPGMLGTPGDIVQDTVKLLRTRGYAVLRMLAHPARFTQTGQMAAPITGPLDQIAAALSEELTGRAAEGAFAVEAALAYLHAQRTGLKDLPHFALGMSGGAMIMPTVMARNPDRWAGGVSIAGGVNYLEILTTSNYSDMIQSLDLLWIQPPELGQDGLLMPRPTQERQAELWRAYLAAAPLDSDNLAPRLAGKPWLLLHGKTDRAVPAVTGERLWNLLRKPERQLIDGGHEWLFLTLTRRLPSIADWLDTQTKSPFHATPLEPNLVEPAP